MANDKSVRDRILNKLTPNMVAVIIILIIASLLTVAIISVKNGSSFEFLGIKISQKTMPIEQNTTSQLTTKIDSLEIALKKVSSQRDSLNNYITANSDKFYDRILRLEKEMSNWGGSISLSIRTQEKTEVYRLIQLLLQRIGKYQGPIDSNSVKTIEALKNYKKAKNFTESKNWDILTTPTIVAIVKDYAEIVLSESRDSN